jgi:carbamoyl-phosphate synthase large subunit
MRTYNILVTGCGGDIAQSIGKILKTYSNTGKLIGCDIHNDHAGHFIFHECFIVERVSSPHYNDSVVHLIKAHHIDIIIPSTEYELEYLLANEYSDIDNCIVIKPNDLAVQIGLDKFSTIKFLEENNLPFPKTLPLDQAAQLSFPFIVKKRRGSGSKTVYKVNDEDTFALVNKVIGNAGICQEYLDSDNEEFTCAVYRSRAGVLRTIQFRRKLTGGYSGFGIVECEDSIDKLLIKVAQALNLIGCINIQLRLQNGIPKIFEINARFSSTVLFRHLFGYEDLIWSIQDALGHELNEYNPPKKGGKFYKGFQEYVVKKD